jgi:hypothetical protein
MQRSQPPMRPSGDERRRQRADAGRGGNGIHVQHLAEARPSPEYYWLKKGAHAGVLFRPQK